MHTLYSHFIIIKKLRADHYNMHTVNYCYQTCPVPMYTIVHKTKIKSCK